MRFFDFVEQVSLADLAAKQVLRSPAEEISEVNPNAVDNLFNLLAENDLLTGDQKATYDLFLEGELGAAATYACLGGSFAEEACHLIVGLQSSASS